MVRDTASMALINTDQTAKNEYYNKVRMVQNQKQEINTVKSEIDTLKNDVNEIKLMLQQLLEKG